MTLKERFYRKFMICPITHCWLWHGAKQSNGYGIIGNEHKVLTAHRVSWFLHREPTIPDGLHVLHKCDVRNCVNPDHLYLGTHQENMADKVKKGRTHTTVEPFTKENYAPLLTWLHEYELERGYFPTFRTIGAHMGLRSTNTVSYHLQKLLKAKLIKRAGRKLHTVEQII
jgi:hypothetical protein